MKYMFKKNVCIETIEDVRFDSFHMCNRMFRREFHVGDLVERFEKRKMFLNNMPCDSIEGYYFVHDNKGYFTTDEHFEEYLEGIKSESEKRFQVHSFNTDEELNAFLVNVEKEDVHLIVPVPMMRNGESTICYAAIIKE